MPAVCIRLFINSEVISGSDLRRKSSEENVVLQDPLGEVKRALVGQTELHKEQASGPTQVPRDETTAHLSEGAVQEEARDVNSKVEEEHETIIQEAQKGLEHLSLMRIKKGLEETTHTMKTEVREEAEAKEITCQLQAMTQEVHTGVVEGVRLKGIKEGPEGITHLTEHSERREFLEIKSRQEKELPLRIQVGCESKLKCFLFCKYQN